MLRGYMGSGSSDLFPSKTSLLFWTFHVTQTARYETCVSGLSQAVRCFEGSSTAAPRVSQNSIASCVWVGFRGRASPQMLVHSQPPVDDGCFHFCLLRVMLLWVRMYTFLCGHVSHSLRCVSRSGIARSRFALISKMWFFRGLMIHIYPS